MVNGAGDLTVPLTANYPEFPDSCLGLQFTVGEEVLDVLVDGANVPLVQLSHQGLRQPDRFPGETAFDPGAAVFSRVEDDFTGGGQWFWRHGQMFWFTRIREGAKSRWSWTIRLIPSLKVAAPKLIENPAAFLAGEGRQAPAWHEQALKSPPTLTLPGAPPPQSLASSRAFIDSSRSPSHADITDRIRPQDALFPRALHQERGKKRQGAPVLGAFTRGLPRRGCWGRGSRLGWAAGRGGHAVSLRSHWSHTPAPPDLRDRAMAKVPVQRLAIGGQRAWRQKQYCP